MTFVDIFGRRPAGVFVTHFLNDRVLEHFARLKKQSGYLIDWQLFHNRWRIDDFIGHRAQLPPVLRGPRLDQALRHGSFYGGYLDVLWISLALATGRRYVWVLEYDVDYSGDWGTFFGQFRRNYVDLLGTTLNPADLDPDWVHWHKAVNPPYVSPRLRTRAYLPILRVSRRFLNVYRRVVCTGEWEGHYEFLSPTIALTFDLSIEDIGGAGPFTPARRIGRNYMNTANDVALSPGTFVCAPSMTTYFHESPHQFHCRDMLYHPVKPFTDFVCPV
jgi:hypothetical protein